MCYSTLTYRQLYSEVANVNVAFFHQVSPDLLQVENGTCQKQVSRESCANQCNQLNCSLNCKNDFSEKIFPRRKEYNQHEPSQFHSRDATDGICTCIRMFGIAVNKAQQLSLAMEILAKGKKKKENQSERKFKWFELQYFIARDT